MLIRRKALGGGAHGGSIAPKTVCVFKKSSTSSKLFRPGCRLLVQRAPLMCGLSAPTDGLSKKFQRPMTKRRSYDKSAEVALKTASLGPKRRFNGMAKLMARAGRGLTFQLPKTTIRDGNTDSEESDSEDEKEPDRPFEPLCVWTSPHQGGELQGLPARWAPETRFDEDGIEFTVQAKLPVPLEFYGRDNVFVPPILAKWLRPHQREGVQFMYECVMGMKPFDGAGCILADDMGLGKTLQSVCLIYTLLKTSITANKLPTCKRIIVVCPCSLVKNWENEFVKWLGVGMVKTLAIAEADRKTVEKNLDIFVKTKMFNVLIASYECIRAHVGRLLKYDDCCDLLVCDEAHRLKNSENQTSKALNSLPVKRRVLLTGTPMQNDLQEFFAMVDFTNPGILGTPEDFRRKTLFPILRGREPDASDAQKSKMTEVQMKMSTNVNNFILRRVNTLNAQHLPPKLVQVVCCNLTEMQQNMYQHLVTSKDMQHALDGKQVNCLGSIQMLMKLCNHPSLVCEDDNKSSTSKRTAASKVVKYTDEDKESTAAPGASDMAKFLPYVPGGGGGRRGNFAPVHPEWSGKMFVLFRLMKEMRKPGNGNDKIVIVSNFTQTLDLIGRMCRENSWGFCRLDGSIAMKKRQKMVDEFNDPSTPLVAFLLSSKAGGCGLNLIGGNRLVLFDPDWNPAVDKQAAARCWRDGQKKRCFTYRFLTTGTVEEKIFQRQLAKEGLQSVVDDKEQVNALSTKDLKNLFKLRQGTPSDTHDKLRCQRCKIIHDNAEMEATKVLPKKLLACRKLLNELKEEEDAQYFLKPLVAADHGSTKEAYEKVVKQPMDLGTIAGKLEQPPEHSSAYSSVPSFCKDVNRVFSNVVKVWSPGDDEIADASRRLQGWWIEKWTEAVPTLMAMKACDDEEDATKPDEDADDADPADAAPASYSTALNRNVRSEDYEEQEGMPDEENMRQWSHHPSANSVDDPVFRAAMYGFDTVSFAFGLEVTWSLIQQRQEQEEARLVSELAQTMDMHAVEEVDTTEDGDDVDDGAVGDDGDTKPAAKPTARKSKPSNPDDVSCDSDSDNDDGSKCEGFIVEDEDDDDGDSDGEAEVPEAVENGDDSESDDDEVAEAAQSGEDSSAEEDDDEVEAMVDSPDAASVEVVADPSDEEVSQSQEDSSSVDEEDEVEVMADSPDAASVEDAADDKQDVHVDSDDEEEEEVAEVAHSQEDSSSDDNEVVAKPRAKRDVMDSLAFATYTPPSASEKSTPCADAELVDTSPESAVDAELCLSQNTDNESSGGTQDTSASSLDENDDPVVAPTTEWACSTCTLHNKKSLRKCSACGAKKPAAPRKNKKRARGTY